MIRALIYARVSTADQDTAMQIADLTTYAAARSFTLVETLQDVASGADDSRPGLAAVMKLARARKIDAVLVWKLDRFGRSFLHCQTCVQELWSLGVRFIAMTEGIDTDRSSPFSDLQLRMMAAFADFERSMIRERTEAGRKRYRDEFAAGRARSRSGKNLAPHRPKKIFDRDQIVELRDSGLSVRAIAGKVGVGIGTVARTLQERSKSTAA